MKIYKNVEAITFMRDKLIEQGIRSYGRTGGAMCALRGSDGVKCAVGHMIPDSHYKQSMEDLTVPMLHESFSDEVLGFNLSEIVTACTASMRIHDRVKVEDWPKSFDHLIQVYKDGALKD